MALAPSLRSLLERPDAARRLGPFLLVHQLGRGGFAPVWLARELYGDIEVRRAAIKLFAFDRNDPSAARERVMEEARLLCRVEHPNIVRFYSLLEDDASGVIGFVMEYVEGASLERRLRVRKRLPVHETLAIGAVIASALSAIHRAGLVHRDVKPANVIEAGGTHKLIDFGVASSGVASSAAGAASSGATPSSGGTPRGAAGSGGTPPGAHEFLPAGTTGYIDPVCAATGAPSTPSSDLYSLGVLLFECLTGRLPSVIAAGAAGGMSPDVLDGHAPSPPVAEHAPDVPPALAALIDSLLSPRRERRPASAEGVVTRLERVRSERQGRKIELPPESVGPFRGLGRFEESDRDVYFGRSAEVAATMDLLRRRGLVTLAGASGTGKSSLARAGVAPQVAEGALGGWIKKWDVLLTAPGPRPREAIATALAPLLPDAAELEPDALVDELAQGAESRGRGVLLVVDQLEELVTVSDGAEAAWLAKLLARVADPPHPFVRALAAARRDLLDPLLALERLGAVLPRSLLVVGPMSGTDWASAIDQALSAYGYKFEDADLRHELLTEIESRATAMPLVQFALSELWKHRDARRKIIPRKGLAEIGGLSGALERHAEATLRTILSETSLPLMSIREVMLLMTTPQGTRAARTPEELEQLMGPEILPLVAKLESARLLVREDDGITLAHDTLLAQWWRLRDWINTAREDRFLGEDVERDAARWAKEREDPSLLWKKRRLAAAEDLLRVGLVKLSPQAERFVQRSRRMERRGRAGLATFAALGLAAAAVAGGLYGRGDTGKDDERLAQQKETTDLKKLVTQEEERQCEAAAQLRARAGQTLAMGRLLRTLQILEKASRTCPASAQNGWHVELEALGQLRRTTEFYKLAQVVLNDASAPAVARETATRMGEALRSIPTGLRKDAGRPFAEAMLHAEKGQWLMAKAQYLEDAESGSLAPFALVNAGICARALGEMVEARILFDRAIAMLEDRREGRLSVQLPLELDGKVQAIEWSADGDEVTVVHGSMASILDGANGLEISRARVDSGMLALAPGGAGVAVETADHGVRVLDVRSGAPVGALPAKVNAVTALAISRKPVRVAVARSDNTVAVWSVAGTAVVGQVTSEGNRVEAVAISDDGKLFALGTTSSKVEVFETVTSKRVAAFPKESGGAVRSITFSPDGALVAWSAEDTTAWIAKVAADAQPTSIGARTAPVTAVRFSADGKYVYAAAGTVVSQWSVAGTPQKVLPAGAAVRAIAISAKEHIAIASEGAPLTLTTADGSKQIGNELTAGRAIAFSPAGDALLAAMDDQTVRSWSVPRGTFLRTIREPVVTDPPPIPAAVAGSVDGRLLLSATGGQAVRFWTGSGGDFVPMAAQDPMGTIAASFASDGTHALTVSGDGRLHVWSFSGEGLTIPKEASTPVLAAAFRPDGRQIMTVIGDGTRRVWDTETGQLLQTLDKESEKPKDADKLKVAVLSPDLRRFVTWKHNALELYETETGALLHKLVGHGEGLILAAVFSRDGKRLYTGGNDRTVRVWDTASGALVDTLETSGHAVRALAVSPSGTLASLLDDGAIRLSREGPRSRAVTLRTLAARKDEEAALVASADGHVDFIGGNACAMTQLVSCRVGLVRLPFEVCEDRFYVAGLLSLATSGDVAYEEPEAERHTLVCPAVVMQEPKKP